MTRTEAINTATKRVSVVGQGPDQYVVHTWRPEQDATHVSHSMSRDGAQTEAWEAKVRISLELLGVEDAGEIANSAAAEDFRGEWRAFVRKYPVENTR